MMNDGGHPDSIAPLWQSTAAPTQFSPPPPPETTERTFLLGLESAENDIIIAKSSERYSLSSLCE